MNKIRWNFERMTKFLESGKLAEFDTSIKNTQKEYLDCVSPAQVYFPDNIFQKLDQVAKISRAYQQLIREVIEARDGDGVTMEQEIENKELVKRFNESIRSCREEILTFIEKQKQIAKK